MKKEIIENIYNQNYASLKEDISKVISEKVISILEHKKVYAGKKFFSLNEGDSEDKSWDRTLDYARQGKSAPTVSTHTGQGYSSVSDWLKDAKDQFSGKAPSRGVASQEKSTQPSPIEAPALRMPSAPSTSADPSEPGRTPPVAPAPAPRQAPAPAPRPAAPSRPAPALRPAPAPAAPRPGPQPGTRPQTEIGLGGILPRPRPGVGPNTGEGSSEAEAQRRPSVQPVPGAADASQPQGGSGVNQWRQADRAKQKERENQPSGASAADALTAAASAAGASLLKRLMSKSKTSTPPELVALPKPKAPLALPAPPRALPAPRSQEAPSSQSSRSETGTQRRERSWYKDPATGRYVSPSNPAYNPAQPTVNRDAATGQWRSRVGSAPLGNPFSGGAGPQPPIESKGRITRPPTS